MRVLRRRRPQQRVEIVRLVDIKCDPGQRHHHRLDPLPASRVQMGEKAVIAEPERHGIGGRQQHRVGSALIVCRCDGERGRWPARGAELSDFAQAIATYFWDKIYPLSQATHPEYWSPDCRPGGALDTRPPGATAWP